MQNFINQTDEEGDVDPETCVNNLNAAIVLLGQAINSLAYERRLSILTTISDHKSAKVQLRDNAQTMMEEKSHLFGEAFRKNMKDLTKAKENAEKIFSNKKPPKQHPKSYHQPFSPRPSYGASRGAGGARHHRGGLFRGKRGKNFVNFNSEICPSKSKTNFLQGPSSGEGHKCRTNSLFRKKLENTDRRPQNSGDSARLETTPSDNTHPTQRAKNQGHAPAGTSSFRHRSESNVRQTRYKGGNSTKGAIPVDDLCSSQEGEKQISSDHKLKKIKRTPSISPFQDGRYERCEKSTEKGGLFSKNRPKGGLLAHTYSSHIKEVYEIQVETKALRNASSCFQGGPGATDLYKIDESTCYVHTETNDTDCYLPGRHTFDREDPRRSTEGKRLSDFSTYPPGLDHQLGKISLGTNPEGRFSGNDGLQDNVNNITRRKNNKTEKYLPGNTSDVTTYPKTPVKFDREIVCDSTSNICSTTSNQILTTGSNTGTKDGIRVWDNHIAIEGGKCRTEVVDEQLKSNSGEPYTSTEPRNDNLLRCSFSTRLGSSNGRGTVNRGDMVSGGKRNLSHQRIGTDSSRTSPENIYKGQENIFGPHLHRQYDSTVILGEKKGGRKAKL